MNDMNISFHMNNAVGKNIALLNYILKGVYYYYSKRIRKHLNEYKNSTIVSKLAMESSIHMHWYFV